jgi:hypothetical protein
MSKELTVQECDANKVDQCPKAGNKNKICEAIFTGQ